MFACPEVFKSLGTTPRHELGANVYNLEIIEHPKEVLVCRLQMSNPENVAKANFSPERPMLYRWTDGSLVWTMFFWLATGSFAIVNDEGICIKKGVVNAWKLSSYTTELWAILEAFFAADAPLTMYTDCETLVLQFAELCEMCEINSTWQHSHWWKSLVELWKERKRLHQQPLTIEWIPSHLYEHVPIELITVQMAQAKQSTVQHIYHNRVADFAARDVALNAAVIRPGFEEELCSHILERHTWLQRLNKSIAVDYQNAAKLDTDESKVQDADQMTEEIAIQFFLVGHGM